MPMDPTGTEAYSGGMSGGSSGDNAGDPIWNTEKGPNGYWAGTKGTFAGLGQGSCNIINGLQDSVIGILNIPGTVVDGIAWVEEKAGILDPNDSLRVGSIPSPDWSSDLVTHEGGEGWTDSHNWSKGLGAGGVEFITGAYWAKISKARKAAQATGLVDDAAEAAGKCATKVAPNKPGHYTDFADEAAGIMDNATHSRGLDPSRRIQNMERKADLKQIDRIANDVGGLTKGQRELLHREITNQNYSLDEIKDIVEEIKELYPNK